MEDLSFYVFLALKTQITLLIIQTVFTVSIIDFLSASIPFDYPS